MIEMKVEGGQEVQEKLSMMAKIIPGSAINGLYDVALQLRNEMIISMRNTPRMLKTYRRGGKVHHPSAPGFPPAIDRGDLVNSLVPEKTEDGARIGSIITNPPYPEFLELGTIKMDERPWAEPALDKLKGDIENTVMKNVIGGIESL